MMEVTTVHKGSLIENTVRLATLLLIAVVLSSCAGFPFLTKADDFHRSSLEGIPAESNQVLLVTDDHFLFLNFRKIFPFEKKGLSWRQAMEPMDVVIGRNGFAPVGAKREGDGRTPSGLYRLGLVFGYAETAATQMPYRQALRDDLWIDDPEAPDYNRWVKTGETVASSYEKMRRDDDLYKYGIVIEYNTSPVITNFGSAIFLHIWAGPRSKTAGCVALAEADILKLIAWLDPAAKPVILLNPNP